MAFAKLLSVIEVESTIGRGTEESPIQPFTEYFSTDGERLAVRDPLQVAMQIEIVKAGDALAHQLAYPEHKAFLDRWWAARHGHGNCTVCSPNPTTHEQP